MRAPGYKAGPLVIPGVVEVILVWDQPNGKRATNVLHAFNPGAIGMTVALANTLFDNIVATPEWTAYALALNSSTALHSIKLRSLDTPLLPQFESDHAAADGTGTLGTVPESVALVVSLKTTIAGRTGRGRVYLTGFDTAFVNPQGRAEGSLTGVAQAFVEMIRVQLGDIGLDLCVANRSFIAYVSPSTGRVVPEGATAGDIIPATYHLVQQEVINDNVFDSQRRRKG